VRGAWCCSEAARGRASLLVAALRAAAALVATVGGGAVLGRGALGTALEVLVGVGRVGAALDPRRGLARHGGALGRHGGGWLLAPCRMLPGRIGWKRCALGPSNTRRGAHPARLSCCTSCTRQTCVLERTRCGRVGGVVGWLAAGGGVAK